MISSGTEQPYDDGAARRPFDRYSRPAGGAEVVVVQVQVAGSGATLEMHSLPFVVHVHEEKCSRKLRTRYGGAEANRH